MLNLEDPNRVRSYYIHVADESGLPADELAQPVTVLSMNLKCTFDTCLALVKNLRVQFPYVWKHRITVAEEEITQIRTKNHWDFGGSGYNTYQGDIQDKMVIPQNDCNIYKYVHKTIHNTPQ